MNWKGQKGLKGQKYRLHISIPLALKRTLEAYSERVGLSMSDVVVEALQSYFFRDEVQNLLRELSGIVRQAEEERRTLNEILSVLSKEFGDLKKAVEVVAFWAALLNELYKARFFQTSPELTDKQYERFKKAWLMAHEIADERLEFLLGKRVWRKKFDPGVIGHAVHSRSE